MRDIAQDLTLGILDYLIYVLVKFSNQNRSGFG